jgi:hypothetical protein
MAVSVYVCICMDAYAVDVVVNAHADAVECRASMTMPGSSPYLSWYLG